MSLTTAFPFRAYEGDIRTRRLVRIKHGLYLSLLSSEDLASLTFVEVRARSGLEDKLAPWQPIRKDGELAATFYDTRMGNFSVRGFPVQSCTTCTNAQCGRLGNERCQGHFGYVRMPRPQVLLPAPEAGLNANFNLHLNSENGNPDAAAVAPARSLATTESQLYVINPHLSDEVEQLLQAKCFFCHRFRAPTLDGARFIQALRLLDAGLLGECEKLLDAVPNARGQELRDRRRREANEAVINTVGALHEYVEQILHDNAHLCFVSRDAKNNQNGGRSSAGPSRNMQNSSLALENNNNSNNNNHADTSELQPANEEAEVPPDEEAEAGALAASLDIRNALCRQALSELRVYPNICTHCGALSPRITTKNGHLFFFFNKKNAERNVAQGVLSQRTLSEWNAANVLHGRTRTYFPTSLVREHIKQLCQHEATFLQTVFRHLGEPPVTMPFACPLPANLLYKVFFIDRVLVPPLPLRLSSGIQISAGGAIAPDTMTRALSEVLAFVEEIEKFYILENKSKLAHGRAEAMPAEKLRAHEQNLQSLQAKVNAIYTEMLDSFTKKEGLFRMYMMGKRVNQACRSVISPDYVLEPNELLLPRPFAKRLSYPEKVPAHAPARVALLQRCVLNGPRVYPGATHLELHLRGGELQFIDLDVAPVARRQLAKRYFAMLPNLELIVHRHILDGDRLMFNRQPTLHKVSMMGYRAKVRSGLKTLRFHYVNGKSYNADFDGDEMNVHVPQSLETRAEVACLMDADLHHLLPTSGRPIRGLIQDHLVAAVLLTGRDKFLAREEFVQLLYTGLAPYLHRGGAQTAVTLTDLIPLPAILAPRPRWTGKQLLSALVRYVTGAVVPRAGRAFANAGLTLHGTSSIQPSAYARRTDRDGDGDDDDDDDAALPPVAMDDDHVHFAQSELLTGVLCKNQLGPAPLSLPHATHDLYGPHRVGELFGALGRTLTASLRGEGFSLALEDMAVGAEPRRAARLRALDDAPLDLPDDEAVVMPVLMRETTALQREFVPGRMRVPFARNPLLLMTYSGAKGSQTNAIQMALGLGQQLFDGRRVRRMNSGKTLPCFFAHERRARAFGYAMGRFTSGIRPGEYVIHAMAGRDGLIDTAVKTSRSGHLQRCLIKAMESLVVHWDHSVRDASGRVVQFIYGGDGLDPTRTGTLQAWSLVQDNVGDFQRKVGLGAGAMEAEGELARLQGAARGKRPRARDGASAGLTEGPSVPDDRTEVENVHNKDKSNNEQEEEDGWEAAAEEAQQRLARQQQAALAASLERDPLPPHIAASLERHLETRAKFPLFRKVAQAARWERQGTTHTKLAAKRAENINYYREELRELTAVRRQGAYCVAGEPVGLLAAQAAGEPSTQMTLNTFHSAGSTVTHVTEGIPRLRELLIYASVKRPAVVVPVVDAGPAEEAALRRILQAGAVVRLVDCLVRVPQNAAAAAQDKNQLEGRRTALSDDDECGYRYHVERGPEDCRLRIALLFSKSKLEDRRRARRMSPAEHLDSFTSALRGFVRGVVSALEGRAEKNTGGEAAGGVRGAVQDPNEMEAALPSDHDDADEDENEEDLLEQENEAEERGSLGPAQPPDDDDDDDDDDEPESDGDEEEDEAEEAGAEGSEEESAAVAPDPNRTTPIAREGSQPLERSGRPTGVPAPCSVQHSSRNAEAAGRVPHDPKIVDYDTFPTIHTNFRNKTYSVILTPLSARAARLAGLANLPDDFFWINLEIRAPNRVVAVVPDVLKRVLHAQRLPSWLPQFDAVRFTRSAEDPTAGELVFQGEEATLRQVLLFLSLFTQGAPGIQLEHVRSTDLQDMRRVLGIESAYRGLYDELDKLFRRYAVDYHHLSLIADTATHCGTWENFNSTGVISHSSSPLFQMSCAASKKFLHTALIRGVGDDLRSISAAVMVGERPKVGTACAYVGPDQALLRDVMERNFA